MKDALFEAVYFYVQLSLFAVGRLRPSSNSRGRRASGSQRQRATFRSSASNILLSASSHHGGNELETWRLNHVPTVFQLEL